MSTRTEANNKNLFIMTLDRSRAYENFAIKLRNVINSNVTVESIRVEMDRLINERNIKCCEIDRVFMIEAERIQNIPFKDEELN